MTRRDHGFKPGAAPSLVIVAAMHLGGAACSSVRSGETLRSTPIQTALPASGGSGATQSVASVELPTPTAPAPGSASTAPVNAPVALYDGVGEIRALRIDATHAYWTVVGIADTVGGSVMKTPLRGGRSEILASGQNEPVPVAVDDHDVYWGNFRRGAVGEVIAGELMKVPVGGGKPILVARQWHHSVSSIAVGKTSVFWTWNGDRAAGFDGSVMRAPTARGKATTIARQHAPDRLAILGDGLFWAAGGKVMMAAAPNYVPVAVAPTDVPPNAIVAHGNDVYWVSEAYGTATVNKMPLGGVPTTLSSGDYGGGCVLAVDESGIYLGASPGRITRFDPGGGNPVTLNSETMNYTVVGLAVDRTHIYWADWALWNYGKATSARVMKMAKRF